MSRTNAADALSPAGDDLRQLLYRFDQAWRSGTPPRIEEYLALLAAARTSGKDASRDFLNELVQLDLEYRWRLRQHLAPSRDPATAGASTDGPLLADYLQRYGDLGPPEQLSLELIGWEYRVRQRWGDRPGHTEYARRFPHRQPMLDETLAQVDAELAAEDAEPKGNFWPWKDTRPAPVVAGTSNQPRGPAHLAATNFPSIGALVDAIRQSHLLSAAQLEAITLDLQGRFREPRALASELLQRNWLTAFQVNQMLQGRGAELTLGPYILLERLGEGGAGHVFKARHQKVDRLVALKILRKELLSDSEVVGRFAREIQVVSRLNHPNVVRAHDAGPMGAVPYLAMEYVEGTNLGRLVKPGSPMPVQQACEYIRQAALGLQHAHEQGLVHRDIKPHNLILSLRDSLIKVADLGLARLSRPANDQATAMLTGGIQGTGSLTPQDAVMMGTADYMAPEQALDFHRADIRADIYSLGCTFYYLLTSQPPFPGGTLAEKVLKHQQAEPRGVEHYRKDVPPELVSVLRMMLAKRPADRFQTPVDVAQALADWLATGTTSLPCIDSPASWRRLHWFTRRLPFIGANSEQKAQQPVGEREIWQRFSGAMRRWPKRVLAATGGFLALLLVGLLLFISGVGRASPPVFLSDLHEEKINSRNQTPGKAFSKGGRWPDGRLLFNNGQHAAKGILLKTADFTGGDASVSYRLGKKYREFMTGVGVCDGPPMPHAVSFAVIGDGRILWKSRPLQKPGDRQDCPPTDIRNIEVLELWMLYPLGSEGMAVHSLWIDPQVRK